MKPTLSSSTDAGTPTGPSTPGKHTPLVLRADDSSNGASTGQIPVMFAIFLIGLLGILGLARDVGYMLAGPWATPGAADAGAIAGPRLINRYTAENPTSALPEFQGAMDDNGFGVLASAKARVERAVVFRRSAPMMVCTSGAWDVTGVEGATVPTDGGFTTIMSGGRVSQAALGQTFRIVARSSASTATPTAGPKTTR